MQTMMVEVNSANALKVLRSLKNNKEINIVDEVNNDSPALPGNPMSLSVFKKWIEDAESSKTISLQQAKKIWAAKRKQLEKATR